MLKLRSKAFIDRVHAHSVLCRGGGDDVTAKPTNRQ